MSVQPRSSIYDRLRPYLDAADLVNRLGLELRRQLGPELYCRPLCHESSSGESLQINAHTGRWNCKACQASGFQGDLFHLVEYVLTNGGKPSHGGQTETHRQAVEWLCGQFGVPFDSERVTGDPGLDVVHAFAMMAHRHLLERPDVLEWIADKWGFDRQTVEGYGLGFMPDPILAPMAAEASRPESRGAFKASGLGWYPPDGRWRTRFSGRVLFPYLEHGRAVYLIGRATPWTPALDNGQRAPKYHKLRVHSDDRPYISERVTNDHLYNEPVMRSATGSVVVAEGVADAVALSALGVPVVSPVTISFNAVDLERFTRKAREEEITRVEILFDNELSGSGSWGARRAGLKLVEKGISARILTLPLGPEQQAARDEVVKALGPELFADLERSDPRRRKEIIDENVAEPGQRAWILEQVAASKIDAAEWSAAAGVAAPGQFDQIRRAGRDVLALEIEDRAKLLDEEADASVRANHFQPVIVLVAHLFDRLLREEAAGWIAKAAGKGVSKAEIARRVADHRRQHVDPKRREEREESARKANPVPSLVLPPPQIAHTRPVAPAAPKPKSDKPAAPPAPGQVEQSEHARYEATRQAVARSVEAKAPQEDLGEFVAQVLTRSMGFTPFRTPEELFLIRGSERIPVGINSRNYTPEFAAVLLTSSGLTARRPTMAGYIAQVVYFLEHYGRRSREVSWSYVEEARGRAVWFPLGDDAGNLVRVEPGSVSRHRMASATVPTVPGEDFEPLAYVEEDGGVAAINNALRWTSLDEGGRLVLLHWLVCLPILRRTGVVPIVRVEGGSSSGKTRTVDAVAYLANGKPASSVPTAAALISRLATSMLTIDDNREARDVTPEFHGTMLQATQLGARQKRRGNTDTGTVVERVCGALLMNGVEPIHEGKPELVSRMLVLRCSTDFRAADSPRDESHLAAAVLSSRDGFWSEALRRCAWAMEADRSHGETLAEQIEEVFGVTKIGRLSTYLRLMVLTWIAGQPETEQPRHLENLPPVWSRAFAEIARESLRSLTEEELTVNVLRYTFDLGKLRAEKENSYDDMAAAFDGAFVWDPRQGDATLGPMRASRLARLAREAGQELNAPDTLRRWLRAGQLEQRILDGLDVLEAAGFQVRTQRTNAGKIRFTFYQAPKGGADPVASVEGTGGGDTWTGPA